MRKSKDDEVRLFSVLLNDRTRGNEQVKSSKFHINTEKKLFHCKSGQALKHVVPVGCTSPSMKILEI